MRIILARLIIVASIAFFPATAFSQPVFDAKTLLEEFSLELFETNAEGFMGPLVIVSNVGANDGFFHTAYVPAVDRLEFKFSVKGMYAGVRDDQKTYIAQLPLGYKEDQSTSTRAFKAMLQEAVLADEVETHVETATVFGGPGAGFTIPKEFIIAMGIPGLDEEALKKVPNELPLTRGTNQKTVFAAVPQLEIGTYKYTQLLVRYIPAVEFDTAVGDFSFFGVALKHGFTNWMKDPPFHAAVQVSYQHSTINNYVGDTRAALAAATDMFSLNFHASRRFGYFEPYIGLSYEYLRSEATYTFTLPKRLVDEIGYDIDPQTAYVDLSDNAIKFTVGITGRIDPVEINIGAGIAKHVMYGAGLSVRFDPPFMDQDN